jgi:ABC-2 type transport system permease protein
MSRFPLALFGMVLRSSLALRGAFLLQACFMALNNLLFFALWWILYERFGQIGGYRLPDMLVLYAVCCCGFGLAVVVCGGLRDIAAKVADGDLDALLTQPKSVLLRVLVSRSDASGWGDLLSGGLLFALSAPFELWRSAAMLLAVLCSASVYVSAAVVFHSSAFWLGRVEQTARTAFEFTMMFSLYPPGLFGPGLRVVLFTLIPAGFIAYLPSELVRDPSLISVALATAGALGCVALARFVFARGLRHYGSGNRMTSWS